MLKSIKVGDKFVPKYAGNVHQEVMTILKVEDSESPDGWAYWDSKELINRKKHHKARIWWFQRDCERFKSSK